MALAIEEAKRAALAGEVPVGAVILRRGLDVQAQLRGGGIQDLHPARGKGGAQIIKRQRHPSASVIHPPTVGPSVGASTDTMPRIAGIIARCLPLNSI